MKIKIINKITITVFFTIIAVQAFANAECPGCPGIPGIDGTDDDPAGSIDQAIIFLIIVAVLTAYYLIRRHKIGSEPCKYKI